MATGQMIPLAPGIFTDGRDPVVGLVIDEEHGIRAVVGYKGGFAAQSRADVGGFTFTGPWTMPAADEESSGAAAF